MATDHPSPARRLLERVTLVAIGGALAFLALFSLLFTHAKVFVWNASAAPVDVSLCGERLTVAPNELATVETNCFRFKSRTIQSEQSQRSLEEVDVTGELSLYNVGALGREYLVDYRSNYSVDGVKRGSGPTTIASIADRKLVPLPENAVLVGRDAELPQGLEVGRTGEAPPVLRLDAETAEESAAKASAERNLEEGKRAVEAITNSPSAPRE